MLPNLIQHKELLKKMETPSIEYMNIATQIMLLLIK